MTQSFINWIAQPECSLDRALVFPCRQLALPVTPLRLGSLECQDIRLLQLCAILPPQCSRERHAHFSSPLQTRSGPHRSTSYQAPPTNPAPGFTFAFQS